MRTAVSNQRLIFPFAFSLPLLHLDHSGGGNVIDPCFLPLMQTMAGLPVLKKVFLDISCSKRSSFMVPALRLLMRGQA